MTYALHNATSTMYAGTNLHKTKPPSHHAFTISDTEYSYVHRISTMVITNELIGTFHSWSLPYTYLRRLVSYTVSFIGGISFDPWSEKRGTKGPNLTERDYSTEGLQICWTCLAMYIEIPLTDAGSNLGARTENHVTNR